MSQTDIDAMQPGPELDALVAEKVMGWEPIDKLNDGSLATEYRKECRRSWHPSTSIEAAWEVVAKWPQDKFMFTLHRSGDMTWTAMFLRYGEPKPLPRSWEARAKIAPEAICKAALKAVSK